MTIYLLTGTPGSGKSLEMAQQIYWHVKFKRPVIANFEIKRDLFKDSSMFVYLDENWLNPQTLVNLSRSYFQDKPVEEGKIKLYIDECSIIFGARTWNEKGRKEWITFLQQHRKLGFDVYLVAQFSEMVDKQIRALVEYEIKHRKVNNIGWFGKVLDLLFFGKAVCVGVTYWFPQKMRLTSSWTIARKKYYQIYDTYNLFGTVQS